MLVTIFSHFQISEEDINNIIYLCDQVFNESESDPFLLSISLLLLLILLLVWEGI